MPGEEFESLQAAPTESHERRRPYSVTGDILSFQRCPRQYGLVSVRGFVLANPVQFYYGTLIHQVLDRAHAHYAGLPDPSTRGYIPTDDDIQSFFKHVDEGLRLRNIRSSSPKEQGRALERLLAFNRIEGPQLYPRVRDTEHRLHADRGDYLLHGTVDVLADSPDVLPGLGVEIWDYKGGGRPVPASEDMTRLEFQMLVYAELFHHRNGFMPDRAILYFLGELADDAEFRPETALMEVPIIRSRIEKALARFDNTVRGIEECLVSDSWLAPASGLEPDISWCTICDFRWDCNARSYDLRYP